MLDRREHGLSVGLSLVRTFGLVPMVLVVVVVVVLVRGERVTWVHRLRGF